MRYLPFGLPVAITLTIAGMMIAGGYNIDEWSMQRIVLVSALFISLILSLKQGPEGEDVIRFIMDRDTKAESNDNTDSLEKL